MEINLVEMWLRRDPVRWIAGAMGGIFAGGLSMALAMWISTAAGYELWFPAKLIGTILLGAEATDIENSSAILAGVGLYEFVCAFLGAVFSHFTWSNWMGALVPMGLVWGVFSWIFIWNLFMQSFHTIYAAQMSSAAVFPICITFGLGLASIALFDRVFRRAS